ncbi:MAG: Ig-like domain-containing protein [Anaerolineales bacterium]|nr:Ig-like domain-containing protein [Anaerolineales bacterium]
MKRAYLFFILTVLLTACAPSVAASVDLPAPSAQEVPQVWIDSPLNGATLPFGAVEILSHAASSSGIAQVELSVNGAVIRTDTNPNPAETLSLARQTWLPAAGGTYQVSVRAQNTKREWSAPVSITVTILEPPTATASPSPTDTPTSAPTLTPTTAAPPTIVLIRNSFCRAGPGRVYDEITGLNTGDTAEVLGINQERTWLFIYWPKFKVRCWIVASAAPPETDLSRVPVLAAPPTPAPTSSPTLAPTSPPLPAPTSSPTLALTSPPSPAPLSSPTLVPTSPPSPEPTRPIRPTRPPTPTPVSPTATPYKP